MSKSVSSSSGRIFDLQVHCRGGALESVSCNLVQSICHLCPRLFNSALLRKFQNGVDVCGFLQQRKPLSGVSKSGHNHIKVPRYCVLRNPVDSSVQEFQFCSYHQWPMVAWASVEDELKTSALSSEDEAMLDQLKSRGRKQNVIQPGCDFPPSQCVPTCGASSGIVRVHHRHVLVPAEIGQALTIAVRFHLVILATACHDFAFQVQCFPFRVSHIPNVRVQVTSTTTTQHRDGAACTILSAQSYILSVAQSPSGGG